MCRPPSESVCNTNGKQLVGWGWLKKKVPGGNAFHTVTQAPSVIVWEAKRIRRGKGKRDKNIYKLLQKLVEMHSVASLGTERVNASVPCPGRAICSIAAERCPCWWGQHCSTHRPVSPQTRGRHQQQLVLSSKRPNWSLSSAASQHLAPMTERWTCSGHDTSSCPHTPSYPAVLMSTTLSCCCQREDLHCKFASIQIIEQIPTCLPKAE